MKKLLFVLSLVIASISAFAEGNCDGGIPFVDVNNSHEYCISNGKMTWWAAFAWCQQNGRHLASLQEACDGWYSMICDNFVKDGVITDYCWTANPNLTDKAWLLQTGTGVCGSNYSREREYRALCK